MTDHDSNKLEYLGEHYTKVEMNEDGSVAIVQSNKRTIPDCVILPADLALSLADMIRSRVKRAA